MIEHCSALPPDRQASKSSFASWLRRPSQCLESSRLPLRSRLPSPDALKNTTPPADLRTPLVGERSMAARRRSHASVAAPERAASYLAAPQEPPPQDDSPPPSAAPSAGVVPSGVWASPSLAAPQEPAPQDDSAPAAASPASGSAAFFAQPVAARLRPRVAAAIVNTFARNIESMDAILSCTGSAGDATSDKRWVLPRSHCYWLVPWVVSKRLSTVSADRTRVFHPRPLPVGCTCKALRGKQRKALRNRAKKWATTRRACRASASGVTFFSKRGVRGFFSRDPGAAGLRDKRPELKRCPRSMDPWVLDK